MCVCVDYKGKVNTIDIRVGVCVEYSRVGTKWQCIDRNDDGFDNDERIIYKSETFRKPF